MKCYSQWSSSLEWYDLAIDLQSVVHPKVAMS